VGLTSARRSSTIGPSRSATADGTIACSSRGSRASVVPIALTADSDRTATTWSASLACAMSVCTSACRMARS
jgi:hypothetical protein